MTELELLDIRVLNGNTPLKAFADLRFKDLNLVIRDWRIIQQEGAKMYVASPQNTWKAPNGEMRYKSTITMPDRLRQKIELLVLPEYERAKEKKNGGCNR